MFHVKRNELAVAVRNWQFATEFTFRTFGEVYR